MISSTKRGGDSTTQATVTVTAAVFAGSLYNYYSRNAWVGMVVFESLHSMSSFRLRGEPYRTSTSCRHDHNFFFPSAVAGCTCLLLRIFHTAVGVVPIGGTLMMMVDLICMIVEFVYRLNCIMVSISIGLEKLRDASQIRSHKKQWQDKIEYLQINRNWKRNHLGCRQLLLMRYELYAKMQLLVYVVNGSSDRRDVY